ncbi:MAG: methyltransferase domain-containing protein [Candidatus Methanomethyliaceae archaeon]
MLSPDSELVRHYDCRYYRAGHGGYQPDEGYFRLLGRYWRRRIFEDLGRDPEAPILDFGAGLGLVTSACPRVVCVEPSEYAMMRLKELGRPVFRNLQELRGSWPGRFRYILLHHVLEHLFRPSDTLLQLHSVIERDGELLIVVPFEKQAHRPVRLPDTNRHLYCWTFQTLYNLLDACGWRPQYQGLLLNPCGLRFFRTILRLSEDAAVRWAARIGSITRRRKAIFFIARSVQ